MDQRATKKTGERKDAGAGRQTKTALVTGSSKGIGKEIALCLARAGYDVGINYHTDQAGAEDTAAQIRALGRRGEIYQADLKDLTAIEAMFAAYFADFGTIDLLVNNAGITRFAPFLETTPQLWEEVVNTDWRGSYFCTQAAARNMVANQISGTLINISSNHASGCWPRASGYGPAKAAVEKMTKNIALELAPHGIRVIGIAPGYTHARNTPPDKMKTDNDPQNDPQIGPLNDPQIGPLIKPLNDPQIGPLKKRIPLQRFAQPEEIGNMVVFLASSLAGYITGTTIYMDGGALLPVLVENTYV